MYQSGYLGNSAPQSGITIMRLLENTSAHKHSSRNIYSATYRTWEGCSWRDRKTETSVRIAFNADRNCAAAERKTLKVLSRVRSNSDFSNYASLLDDEVREFINQSSVFSKNCRIPDYCHSKHPRRFVRRLYSPVESIEKLARRYSLFVPVNTVALQVQPSGVYMLLCALSDWRTVRKCFINNWQQSRPLEKEIVLIIIIIILCNNFFFPPPPCQLFIVAETELELISFCCQR